MIRANQGPYFAFYFLIRSYKMKNISHILEKLRIWKFKNEFLKVRNGLIDLHVLCKKNSVTA